MVDERNLESLLPEAARQRVASLRVKGGRVLAVLDGAGLSDPERAALEEDVRTTLAAADGISAVNVAIMGERPARQVIAVGSGKGGVGKSTLTTNLALALARAGHRVGVVDADIYGPSQARLLATEGQKPEAEGKQLKPLRSPHGVAMLSMANLVDQGRAIAWRGPMASGALGQLMEADWGDTEILLIDLPPGTGDIQLSMLQKHRPDGAVIVSTPQDLALIDAVRAGQLFDAGGVPVLGLVENMAGYICPHCGEASDPFGSGGIEAAAAKLDLPFLGRVPLTMELREASDAGTPITTGAPAAIFDAIAAQLVPAVAGRD